MFEENNKFIDKIVKIYKSKTIWFNATIAALIPLLPELINAIPELQPYLPTDTYKTLTLIGLVGNIYLRFKTNTSLAAK